MLWFDVACPENVHMLKAWPQPLVVLEIGGAFRREQLVGEA
jgi:hypothetical protein